MTAKKTNWAIIAPGKIAKKFSRALQGMETANLYSVASRSAEKAESFANEMGFTTFAKSQKELLADPQVDVIYIASPHTFHTDTTIECLNAGKAVLCEKPMSVNTAEAKHVFAAAKANNVFYMEAVWSRFMPVLGQVLKWISEDEIGQVKMIQSSFGFSRSFDQSNRLYDLNLAGGALLDVGIYTITFAQMVMQCAPQTISAIAHIGKSGVDENNVVTLQYPNGTIATLNSSITTQTSQEAWVYGTKGRIKIPTFWRPEKAFLISDEKHETFTEAHKINGYEYEIEEVQKCLSEQRIESPKMSWDHSKMVMEIMDDVRNKVGLVYPNEKFTHL